MATPRPYVKALITEEQKKALKRLALERDIDMQDMCRDAILALLQPSRTTAEIGADPSPRATGAPSSGGGVGEYPYAQANKEWHDTLETVLNSPLGDGVKNQLRYAKRDLDEAAEQERSRKRA